MENIITEIQKLSFIQEFYPETIEYRTEESDSPAAHKGNGGYEKLNIHDTLRGVGWIYHPTKSVASGELTQSVELYIIVNTVRAKMSDIDIQNSIINMMNGLGLDFSIEIDATRALSRYNNFFELNKQIGKIPYLCYRVDFEDSYTLCL